MQIDSYHIFLGQLHAVAAQPRHNHLISLSAHWIQAKARSSADQQHPRREVKSQEPTDVETKRRRAVSRRGVKAKQKPEHSRSSENGGKAEKGTDGDCLVKGSSGGCVVKRGQRADCIVPGLDGGCIVRRLFSRSNG